MVGKGIVDDFESWGRGFESLAARQCATIRYRALLFAGRFSGTNCALPDERLETKVALHLISYSRRSPS